MRAYEASREACEVFVLKISPIIVETSAGLGGAEVVFTMIAGAISTGDSECGMPRRAVERRGDGWDVGRGSKCSLRLVGMVVAVKGEVVLSKGADDPRENR